MDAPIYTLTNSIDPFSLHLLQHLLFVEFFNHGHSDHEVIPHYNFVCISLIISDTEQLFMSLLAICMSLEKCLVRSSIHFLMVICFFDIGLHDLFSYFGE